MKRWGPVAVNQLAEGCARVRPRRAAVVIGGCHQPLQRKSAGPALALLICGHTKEFERSAKRHVVPQHRISLSSHIANGSHFTHPARDRLELTDVSTSLHHTITYIDAQLSYVQRQVEL